MKDFFPESLGQKHGYALYVAKYGHWNWYEKLWHMQRKPDVILWCIVLMGSRNNLPIQNLVTWQLHLRTRGQKEHGLTKWMSTRRAAELKHCACQGTPYSDRPPPSPAGSFRSPVDSGQVVPKVLPASWWTVYGWRKEARIVHCLGLEQRTSPHLSPVLHPTAVQRWTVDTMSPLPAARQSSTWEWGKKIKT